MADLEGRTNGVTQEQMKAAKGQLFQYYGLYAAAARTGIEENTGAMISGGAPLLMAPYKTAITPTQVARRALEQEVEATGNVALSQFLEDFKGILSTDEALKKFNELYQKGFKERKLSEIVDLTASLGVDVTPYRNAEVTGYMDKKYEDLEKDVKKFSEDEVKAQKEGKTTDPKDKLHYAQLSATMKMLQSEINAAYNQKLQAQAQKMQRARYRNITDHTKQDDLIEAIRSDGDLRTAMEKYQKASKKANLDDQ
ncbi:MAG: hypothetical protein NTX24_01840 [Candidatus Pacearchaeota archaeon]|nr:hypothetical protein [Candidatus Pacearchaeota archaeon]